LLSCLDNTYVIAYDSGVTTKTATQARANLYRLLDQVARTHEPVAITGRRHNGVLISEEDWRAVQETLYLLSVPGMRESIRRGLKTPLSKTSDKPGW
jgi:antitoxin YefM